MLQQNKGGRHTVAPKFPNFRVSTRRQGTSVETLAEDNKKRRGGKGSKTKENNNNKKKRTAKIFFYMSFKII
jgi:hypothetical protein